MNRTTTVVRSFVVLIGVLLLLGACSGENGENNSPPASNKPKNQVDIRILFDSDDCPQSVSPNKPVNLYQSKGTYIVWTAVDQNDKPKKVAYGVYYNPFKGKSSNRHTNNGTLKSAKVDTKAPAALQKGTLYKYTILADKCPDKPLDPRIRVQR